jgi:dGTPase
MRDYGGFEHNLQSLRVVDELEERYADFPGLNLTFETREGILKHCSVNNARKLGDLGVRFIERRQPGLEAQLANLADAIAYNNHDVDDGLRAGLITLEELADVPLIAPLLAEVSAKYPGLDQRRTTHETIRRMIGQLVGDVVQTSRARLDELAPFDIDAVRESSEPMILMSEEIFRAHTGLKQFLRDHVYRHYKVLRMTTKARRVLKELFEAFMLDTRLLPDEHRDAAVAAESEDGDAGRARTVADYIAGMTDRYAILEHRRMFDPGART